MFLDDEGNLLFDPIDTTPDKDPIVIDEINESMRIRQVRYLKTTAKNLLNIANSLPDSEFKTNLLNAGNGVNMILNHYASDILSYEKYGTDDWKNSIEDESDPFVLSILDALLRAPDEQFPNGLTGRQSIMFQLTGVIP